MTEKSQSPRTKMLEQIFSHVRAGQRLTDAVDETAGKLLGTNRTDGQCMDLLDERGQQTAGMLAEETGLTTGAITAVLDRLEQLGYVQRVRDTEDRRRVLVELTPKAKRATWELYGPLGEMGAELAERYSDEQLEVILDFVDQARQMSAQHLAALRTRLAAGQALSQAPS
jgi:DNA-binding MarR family transcriptional regulator